MCSRGLWFSEALARLRRPCQLRGGSSRHDEWQFPLLLVKSTLASILVSVWQEVAVSHMNALDWEARSSCFGSRMHLVDGLLGRCHLLAQSHPLILIFWHTADWVNLRSLGERWPPRSAGLGEGCTCHCRGTELHHLVSFALCLYLPIHLCCCHCTGARPNEPHPVPLHSLTRSWCREQGTLEPSPSHSRAQSA